MGWTKPRDGVWNPGVQTQTRQQNPAAGILYQQNATGENVLLLLLFVLI